MFFRLKLWLTVVLFGVAGALLLLMGTPFLYERVMPVYDTMTANVGAAIAGELVLESQSTLDAATRASADAGVRAAIRKGEMSPPVEATLLATADSRANATPDGRFGAPSFALLVRADGRVVARVGKETKLEDQLQGYPLVEDANRGFLRDGFYEMGDQQFHVVASPVFDGAVPLGVVLLGWQYDTAFVDHLAKSVGVDLVLVTPTMRLGSSLPDLDADFLRGLIQESPFGEPQLSLPAFTRQLQLPLLVPMKHRYLASTVQLYPGERSARIVAAIDRNPALNTIASAQLAVIAATLALGIFLMLIIWTTLRSISRPMSAIMDHLSQFQQGTVVGILPESALSGPFVRLGKQINMILQMMPTTSRPGAALGGALGSLGSSPAMHGINAGIGGPSGPSLAAGGPTSMSLPTPAVDDDAGLKFDGIPGLSDAKPSPVVAPSPAPVPAAKIAASGSPTASGPAIPAPGPSNPGALPLAAAPLGGGRTGTLLGRGPTPMSGAMPAVGGGSGATPAPSGLSNLFDDGPDPLAAFRVPAGAAPKKPAPAPAPEPTAQDLADAAADPFDGGGGSNDGGATVMFEVPKELIQKSVTSSEGGSETSSPGRMTPAMLAQRVAAQPPTPAARPAPVEEGGNRERTVIAAVPQDLLNASAPKSDVSAAESAHYREVYEKFVQTRKDCGEDTSDLTVDRFITKLLKNRQQIMEKHAAKSVRFQVYVKEGKAALRALPVRE
jgi:hypothetical protein